MQIIVEQKDSGRTLLSYLKSDLKMSSACITKLKRENDGLTINGNHVTVRYILQTDDVLQVNFKDNFDNVSENVKPSNIPLEIIYEDENVLALNKPPFMPTHPSRNHYEDTLANAVSYLYQERGLPLVFRSIGRLDRNTSGIVILAKNMPSAAQLSKSRKDNEIRKSYIAIVCGELQSERGEIDSYIKRVSDSIITRTVCDKNDENALFAYTKWECLYAGHGISLVKVNPKTGRTHQIRVHFSSTGHPLLGDDMYGFDSNSVSINTASDNISTDNVCMPCDGYIKRHALHASDISFPLPFSNASVSVTAPLPKDMKDAFTAITGEDIEQYIPR